MTIDKAGRLVIPREVRERVGLQPGPVDLEVDGAALRLQAVAGEDVVEVRGRPLVGASPQNSLDDAEVRRLRDADRR
ncbi:AbrB/MazE/SpoVT family DNA-binding domain-containing protein [Pseudokineococcus basanitobsidens]|uniref:AbrB/MazE/SpoVT family DNA-binding domain-containing protein n=1 Tax=Pseudokineococcus basanitobsidens TaxID=1926649 RepID=A0ABU8RMQ0_9ACTN